MVLCDNVKVPWERVFCINDATHSYRIYNMTPIPLLRQPSV